MSKPVIIPTWHTDRALDRGLSPIFGENNFIELEKKISLFVSPVTTGPHLLSCLQPLVAAIRLVLAWWWHATASLPVPPTRCHDSPHSCAGVEAHLLAAALCGTRLRQDPLGPFPVVVLVATVNPNR